MAKQYKYRPRILSPHEWKEWAQYSFYHHDAPWSEFDLYLKSRLGGNDQMTLPGVDVMLETYQGSTGHFHALALQRIVGSNLVIDYLSVYYDEPDEQEDDRILEIANVIETIRKFVSRNKRKNTFPNFKSIILNDTVGQRVIRAASTLNNINIELASY